MNYIISRGESNKIVVTKAFFQKVLLIFFFLKPVIVLWQTYFFYKLLNLKRPFFFSQSQSPVFLRRIKREKKRKGNQEFFQYQYRPHESGTI